MWDRLRSLCLPGNFLIRTGCWSESQKIRICFFLTLAVLMISGVSAFMFTHVCYSSFIVVGRARCT